MLKEWEINLRNLSTDCQSSRTNSWYGLVVTAPSLTGLNLRLFAIWGINDHTRIERVNIPASVLHLNTNISSIHR